MTDIPDDIMKTAFETACAWLRDSRTPTGAKMVAGSREIVNALSEHISLAILADRERSAKEAEYVGNEFGEPWLGSAISAAIMKGPTT